jgi:hypothetical protein
MRPRERGVGPPGKERPDGYQAARPNQKKLADATTNQLDSNAAPRRRVIADSRC